MTLRMCEKEREGRERQKIDRENGASKPFSHYRNQASMKLNVTTVIKMVFIASVTRGGYRVDCTETLH